MASSGTANMTVAMPIAKIADASDHQNPGAFRITRVVMSPVIPPITISHIKIAIPYPNGTKPATHPNTTRIVPSTSSSFQWRCGRDLATGISSISFPTFCAAATTVPLKSCHCCPAGLNHDLFDCTLATAAVRLAPKRSVNPGHAAGRGRVRGSVSDLVVTDDIAGTYNHGRILRYEGNLKYEDSRDLDLRQTPIWGPTMPITHLTRGRWRSSRESALISDPWR